MIKYEEYDRNPFANSPKNLSAEEVAEREKKAIEEAGKIFEEIKRDGRYNP